MGLESRILASALAFSIAGTPLSVASKPKSSTSESYVSEDIEPIKLTSRSRNGEVLAQYDVDNDQSYDVSFSYSPSGLYIEWEGLDSRLADPSFDLKSFRGFGAFEVLNPALPNDNGPNLYFVLRSNYQFKDRLGDTVILRIDTNKGEVYLIKLKTPLKERYFLDRNLVYNISNGSFEENKGSGWAISVPLAVIGTELKVDKKINLERIFLQYPDLVEQRVRDAYPNDTMSQILEDLRSTKAVEWGINSRYETEVLSAVHHRVGAEALAKVSSEINPVEGSVPLVPVSFDDKPKEVIVHKTEGGIFRSPYFWGAVGGIVVIAGGIILTTTLYEDETITRTVVPGPITPSSGGQDVKGH